MPLAGVAGLAQRAVSMRGAKRKSTMVKKSDEIPMKGSPSFSERLMDKTNNPSLMAAVYQLGIQKV